MPSTLGSVSCSLLSSDAFDLIHLCVGRLHVKWPCFHMRVSWRNSRRCCSSRGADPVEGPQLQGSLRSGRQSVPTLIGSQVSAQDNSSWARPSRWRGSRGGTLLGQQSPPTIAEKSNLTHSICVSVKEGRIKAAGHPFLTTCSNSCQSCRSGIAEILANEQTPSSCGHRIEHDRLLADSTVSGKRSRGCR